MTSKRELDEAQRNGGKLFVGNLRKFVDKQDIETVFSRFGQVLQVWVAQNPPGFAFITYRDSEQAKDACDSLNGKDEPFAEA